jgi:hypothetical protein
MSTVFFRVILKLPSILITINVISIISLFFIAPFTTQQVMEQKFGEFVSPVLFDITLVLLGIFLVWMVLKSKMFIAPASFMIFMLPGIAMVSVIVIGGVYTIRQVWRNDGISIVSWFYAGYTVAMVTILGVVPGLVSGVFMFTLVWVNRLVNK